MNKNNKFPLPKRTKIEFLIIIISIILIVLFSWIELKFFGVNSYLFLIVFNLNIILLLVILFVVVRNSIKLFLDRKRKVKGAKLRTRLVISFMLVSLIPTILMFLIAIKFVQTSINYWFKNQNQIDYTLNTALELGKANYKYIQDDLREKLQKISRLSFEKYSQKQLASFLEKQENTYNIDLLLLASKNKEIGDIDNKWKPIWNDIRTKINWNEIKGKGGFTVNIYSYGDKDYVIGILSIKNSTYNFIIGGIELKYPITKKMERVVQGADEYNQLKSLKNPIKMSLYILLAVITLLIMFGSMWFGLKLAKEISSPIRALSTGTAKIADGDLKVRVEEEAEDELGALVKSFNDMAEKLEQSQNRLNQANQILSAQNRELEHRRQYMEAVLNTITSGVISLDKDLKINTINNSAIKILNLSMEKILGKSPKEFMPSQYLQEFERLLGILQKSPDKIIQRQIDFSINKKEKKLLLNILSLKGQKEEHIGTIIVFEDITELDKMQRLAAWQEVARRIAHEIKNPLTPIKLSAQRLERKFSSSIKDQTFNECTQVIVRQVDHLQRLVKEFSDFAKLPEIVPSENDLGPLIQELLILYKNSYPHIKWDYELDQDIPKIKFDRSALKRVFINIFNNAVEALEEKIDGTIQIECKHDEPSGSVIITIQDNGPGLNSEELSRIFEPYFSRKKGSTGLGLTIARSIIKDHHGDISVSSNYGAGTTFTIVLPG